MSSTVTKMERRPVRLKDRFEVFKRDEFTCVYCGRTVPQVTLEIDHLVPVAEGGGSEVENLVTSCWDCNRGKGARPLDRPAPIVDLDSKTEVLKERERQVRAYNEAKAEQRERRGADYQRVIDYWHEAWGEAPPLERWYLPYKNVLQAAIDELGVEEVLEAIDTTAAKFDYLTSKAPRYFGGILKWKRLAAAGRVTECIYCGEKMELSVEEAAKGEEWFHTSCKPAEPEPEPESGPELNYDLTKNGGANAMIGRAIEVFEASWKPPYECAYRVYQDWLRSEIEYAAAEAGCDAQELDDYCTLVMWCGCGDCKFSKGNR